jgi:hypothetical protein
MNHVKAIPRTILKAKQLPNNCGSVTHAGPGLCISAAIGPLRFVGVHGRCSKPPIFIRFD